MEDKWNYSSCLGWQGSRLCDLNYKKHRYPPPVRIKKNLIKKIIKMQLRKKLLKMTGQCQFTQEDLRFACLEKNSSNQRGLIKVLKHVSHLIKESELNTHYTSVFIWGEIGLKRNVPVYPGWHRHTKPLDLLIHTPWRQDAALHCFACRLHTVPLYPGRQKHRKLEHF